MADLAVPQAANTVDVFVSLVVPQEGTFAFDDVDKRIGSWLGKRVKEATWHVSTVRQQMLARS
ncbi:unannotated protein [freshwater metagenome]|uniref:Unannotated protein n=1 Tax=freshwater metagenome TaxID=449393 RepID=A0A6J6GPU4_9ZZZZ